MKSIRQLYRIGSGPSSSHTMGPRRAAEQFCREHPDAASFRVTLFGSLASTGRGHLTDKTITDALAPKAVEFAWNPDKELPEHPNGMLVEALSESGGTLDRREYYSIGGGALLGDAEPDSVYPLKSIEPILRECERSGEAFWEYVRRYEGDGIDAFCKEVWEAMSAAVERGLHAHGVLPGGLGLPRKASSLFTKAKQLQGEFRSEALLAAYAYAVAEENASGGVVVTAPTCGSCGVLPATLYYLKREYEFDEGDIVRALLTAGLFGNAVKHNASISGAAVGCQGEIGTACAMAAAAAAQLQGGSPSQIEYAAEMGLEHHLGLTCDPVSGLVQIPCIERNAHAAARSLNCGRFALLSDGLHRIGFDDVVTVMYETGRLLPKIYRETSMGGLAKIYEERMAKGDASRK